MEDRTVDARGLVAVVTGASRGIGAGLVEGFLRRGMSVGACARTRPGFEDSDRVVARSLDVSDLPAVERFTAEVFEQFDQVDLWINNAGVLEPIGPQRDVELEAVRRHLQVNVLGVWIGSRCFVRGIRKAAGSDTAGRSSQASARRRPVLINISSGAGRKPYAGWAAYCAGKAAVDRLTEVIALEERGLVRAYAVAPGVVDTGMQELIRAQQEADFPTVERFRAMAREGSFTTVEQVTAGMLQLAFGEPQVEDVLVDLRDLFTASQ